MPKEIVMPKLGESVVEGVIGRWLKKEGDRVEEDEPLVEIDTDKVNAEVPSPYAGVVYKLVASEGETVPVGGLIAMIQVDEEDEGAEVKEGAQPKQETRADEQAGGGDAGHGAQGVSSPFGVGFAAGVENRGSTRAPHLYTPAVRRLAQESGIDPAEVPGTGAGGRVTKKDMERAIAAKNSQEAILSHVPVSPPPFRGVPDAIGRTVDGDEVIPVTRLRRTIAERMVHSTRTVPHAWTTVEVDVTSLVKFRESIKEEFRRREGINLTYLPFVVKAAVEALREYPILNSTWEEDRIVIKKHIHIGIAVDLDDGLIVPVIRDADQRSIVGLAKAISDLATRARSGALTPDDVTGGTFTINNTGAFGSILSAPIINYPQAAILSMETITRRPVVVGDAIGIRSMMNLCMSLDHRVLDGAVCGRFLKSVKERLEAYDSHTPLY